MLAVIIFLALVIVGLFFWLLMSALRVGAEEDERTERIWREMKK